MSLDLVELSKIKVSIECHSLLNAHASVLSKHQNEVARLVLEKWAEEQARIAKIANAEMRSKGLAGILGEAK